MRIAYLAPELPALSATFVYEELLGLERRGVQVIPVSVRRPGTTAQAQGELARRTRYLYDPAPAAAVLGGLLALPSSLGRLGPAAACLARDLLEAGAHRPSAWKLAAQFLAGAKLARILGEEGCRHLHVHFAHVPAQIGMYAAALSGVPFTVTGHANDLFERALLLRRKVERAAKFLTVSEYNRIHLVRLGADGAKLGVVRCGVSLPIAARPREGTGPGPWRIGSLGRMVEKKGMDVLLRAAAVLRAAGLDLELRLAGDGPMRASLEALAADLGLAQAVRFDGALAHGEVAAWLRELDCFALACRRDARGDMDGIPVVLMEAMAQGIPVVSTRLSGIPELVVHERTGLLAAPGDAASLAREIERLAGSPELARRLAAGALEHVRTEFGPDVNLERLAAHLGIA